MSSVLNNSLINQFYFAAEKENDPAAGNTPPQSPTKFAPPISPGKRKEQFSTPSPKKCSPVGQKRMKMQEPRPLRPGKNVAKDVARELFSSLESESCEPSYTLEQAVFKLSSDKDANAARNLTELFSEITSSNIKDKEEEEFNANFNELANNCTPIPEGDPFAKTGLVVFPDSFTGLLPLNGIKQLELTEITALYQDIVDGKTRLLIHTTYSKDTYFKKVVNETIKKILTRKLGRIFIQKILAHPCKDKIYIKKKAPWEANYLYQNRTVTDFYINFELREPYDAIGKVFFGNKRLPTDPYFISLLHELIHVWHYMNDPDGTDILHNSKVPNNVHMHTKEEERTITPLCDEFCEVESEVDDVNQLMQVIEYKEENFTENNFRAIFSLPLRLDHRSVIRKPHQIPSSRASDYFVSILSAGVLDEVKAMVAKGMLTHAIDRHPILFAAKSGCLTVVKYLVENHLQDINLQAVSDKGNLLEHAIRGGSSELFLWLIEFLQKNSKLEKLLTLDLFPLAIRKLKAFSLPIVDKLAQDFSANFPSNFRDNILKSAAKFDVLPVFEKYYNEMETFIKSRRKLATIKQGLLEIALENFSPGVAQFLANKGIKVETKQILNKLWNAMQTSINYPLNNLNKIFDLLTALNVDINTSFTDTGDALLHLVFQKQLESWKDFLMLRPEIDLQKMNRKGQTASQLDPKAKVKKK